MTDSYSPMPIISVFIEQHKDEVAPVCYELIGAARELASQNNMDVFAVLCQNQNQRAELDSLEYLVDHIDIYYYEENYSLNVLDYRNCLNAHIYEHRPMIVLIGATPLGRTFAPRVAAHFKTGITADCTELEYDGEDGLIQIRPAYGGDVIAKIITPKDYPQMATVRPGVMEEAKDLNTSRATIERHEIDYIEDKINILKREKVVDRPTKLEDAEVVILAGNAIRYPEELKLIMDLAELFDGEWAVTRPLVEGGLAPYERQVGISGKTIRPKLVMAFGVSGTTQTLSGISKSERIIAVNTDRNAPIFKNSDIGILGDWKEVANSLIERLNKGKPGEN